MERATIDPIAELDGLEPSPEIRAAFERLLD